MTATSPSGQPADMMGYGRRLYRPTVLEALGVDLLIEADPLNHHAAVDVVKRAIDASGVRAIIFKSPCVANLKKTKTFKISLDQCKRCKACVKLIGCPAQSVEGGAVVIEPALCSGCSLCEQICPHKAIGEAGL
jgi:indolepyruvate ferredoxin oxidoreductase alpha subunit